MREISATDASRGFADLLDDVEHNRESFLISRNGRIVARIEPTSGATGKVVKKLLQDGPRDSSWARELEELRAAFPAEVADWPE